MAAAPNKLQLILDELQDATISWTTALMLVRQLQFSSGDESSAYLKGLTIPQKQTLSNLLKFGTHHDLQPKGDPFVQGGKPEPY